MEIKLDHFLDDLIWLIKEDYNESIDEIASAQTDTAKSFAEGQNLAYQHVLQTIENQLFAFGASVETCSGIAPEVGRKADLKKASL